MLKFHLRTSLILLALGFILGFGIATFISGYNKAPTVKNQMPVKPKELNIQADNLGQEYQEQIAKLQNENLELQQNLEVTSGLLDQAKQDARERETIIKRSTLFDSFRTSETLLKFNPTPSPHVNTSPCDSLVNEVTGYIEANHFKDSLYEQQLLQMDSVTTIKDKLIDADNVAYKNLNLLFEQSLENQQALLSENISLKKKYKRQKLKGKLFTLGATVVSGFAANYFLHH